MTDPLGQSQVLPYLCGLSALGYNIHLISAEKKEAFGKLHPTIQKICDTNDIVWHPLVYHNKPSILGTLYDIYQIRKLAYSLHKTHNFSLVHCRSYIPSFIGSSMKHRFNIPFLFDMRGFWVDEKNDGKVWNLNNPVFRLVFHYMKNREVYFFNSANAIISLTHKACPEIRKISGNSHLKNNIEVIPCCVDTGHFNTDVTNEDHLSFWKEKLEPDNDAFYLCYLGSLSTWYLPGEMLRFFKVFLRHQPRAIFLLITLEDTRDFMLTAASLGIPEHKIKVVSSSRSQLPALLSLCHASVFFITPAYSKMASSPTKLGELMSMGIPVICNAGVGDTEELVIESGAGLVCREFTEGEYEKVSKEFIALYPGFDKEKLRREAIRLFSIEHGIEKYRKVYEMLLDQE